MRNIFVEGVRSAFIRIIRMLVYIVIGLIVFYIIGLFTTHKVKAEIINKGQYGLGGWQQNQKNGYIVPNSSISGVPPYGDASIIFQLNNEFTPDTSYDYVGFKMWFDVYRTTELGDSYCPKYVYSYGSNGQITSMQCSGPYTNSPVVGSYDIQVIAMNSNNETTHCFFSSDIDNVILCPTARKINRIGFHIGTSYSRLEYRIELNNSYTYYNMGSTEIVNALNGVALNQTNTTTMIQQQTTYIQNDSTTQSTTQATNSFTIMSNEITQQLSGLDDLTQVVLAPISLFVELATDTCSPIVLTVPFVNYQATLPCMKPIFNQYFSGLYTVFTTAISAIITYWVSVKTLSLIKDILDCDNDRIEVIDL